MGFRVVLGAVAVANIDKTLPWYERLFGRDADDRPMREAAEWRLLDGGGVQVVEDAARAGGSMVSIGVDDVDALVAEVSARGIAAEATTPGGGLFRLARIADPDGNMLTFAQDLRGN